MLEMLNSEVVEIPYRPLTHKHWQFHSMCEETEQIALVVSGTGFGKTFMLISQLIKWTITEGMAWNFPKPEPPYLCICMAPTYKMLSMIHWPIIKSLFPPRFVKKFHDSDCYVELINGALFVAMSAENNSYERVRGLRPNVAGMDEAKMVKKAAFELLLNRLSYRNGKVIIATTPDGFDWTYDVEQMSGKSPNKIKFMHAISTDNPKFKKENIDAQKDLLSKRLFDQEFFGIRMMAGGAVYYSWSRATDTGNVKQCLFNKDVRIEVMMDFNVNPMSTAIGQLIGDELWIIDEISMEGANINNTCEELCERYQKYFKVSDEQIIWNLMFWPDPSGHNKQHSGFSDVELIKNFFKEKFNKIVQFTNRRKAPFVKHRTHAVNSLMLNANGKRRLFVDPKCVKITESFDKCAYKEGTNEVDKSLNIEHMADAIGYFVEYNFPVFQEGVRAA